VSVWQDLRDQDRVIARLRKAIECDRVPHAYLFSGPPGAPMFETALALARALSCQRAHGEGCGLEDASRCGACEKISAGIHPDVVTLAREGAAQMIPIETVRSQVIARLGLPPHEGEVRVFLVEEATAMAPPAANALLKTLEEPPARTLFVLCTTAPEQLLPTIRSRCQRVRFGGGAAIAADADPARAERVAALGAELAADRHDPSLPSRIAEAKGDAAPVLVAAAQLLHGRAHAAARAGDLDAARRAAGRAQAILSWHIAVSIHNANPVLAIDALIVQLDRLPGGGAAGVHAGAPGEQV
jgi:DNA polymerase-3 subunit delta'